MYILENSPVLDHATFARFRSVHFEPCSERIMAEMVSFLHETDKNKACKETPQELYALK